jgi:hypothetical protein
VTVLPGGEDLLRAMGEESAATEASRAASRGAIDVPGAEPCGHRPESRLCVVGATGFEPARARLWGTGPVLERGGSRWREPSLRERGGGHRAFASRLQGAFAPYGVRYAAAYPVRSLVRILERGA